MAAILLSGEREKYVFSIINTKQNLPDISGFYILVKSPDKYGIRHREYLATGYCINFSQEKESIDNQASDYTHIYLMPDFDRDPHHVLEDIKTSTRHHSRTPQQGYN